MTSERDCVEALREAADRLGESPTKAQYEALGLRPASATIQRVMGGWNEAKEAAGLETNPSTGSRTAPKPDHVDLPEGASWEELTVDQRWHYRNREWNTERTLDRRARIRAWVNAVKGDRGCARCDESDPACLDFHHLDSEHKEMAITEMVTYGYGREALREEMANCEVLCANCHRKTHAREDRDRGSDERGGLRTWVRERKRTSGGCARCGMTTPACLDFHHDGDAKRATVAELVSDDRSKSTISDEMDDCIVLCANCHRKEHFEPPATDD